MADFSLRTLNVKRGGRSYRVHIRAYSKELWDLFDRMAEKLETSNIDRDDFGPFELTIRRDR